ncbi:Global transcription regulator sge1 [Entomophthora muscae]|uniref:Global transcription regulator sge1 n=1 Tax=Entomophthora muscae TaxID=34485 RepID=A0ACC2S303_9FUNG|nr:Global transcription regulator sge1 [Entomophthora muscae]
MQEYRGVIETVFDAFLLVELAIRGYHPLASIRPNFNEFTKIEAGAVFVFDKTETGMTRWIDGKSWSPSRFKGGFFTYTELVNKKPTGLFKKAISVIAPNGHHFQIIGYYTQDMCMITSRLPRAIEQLADSKQIYDEAEKYRYFKCFRSQSKSWRQPCPFNSSSEATASPEKTPKVVFSPPSQSIPISLPSISNLIHFACMTPNPTPYLYQEDIKQLSLLTPFSI